jgi:hypothetical protein
MTSEAFAGAVRHQPPPFASAIVSANRRCDEGFHRPEPSHATGRTRAVVDAIAGLRSSTSKCGAHSAAAGPQPFRVSPEAFPPSLQGVSHAERQPVRSRGCLGLPIFLKRESWFSALSVVPTFPASRVRRVLYLRGSPSTNSSMPVTKLESPEARKSATVAISRGCPMRLTGMIETN